MIGFIEAELKKTIKQTYSIIAIKQTIRGIKTIHANEFVLAEDLRKNPEVLAEAIQTILRKNGYEKAYDILKNMTRGKDVTLLEIREFINGLDINEEDKGKLIELTPDTYIGLANKLAENL